jgi:CHAT domain
MARMYADFDLLVEHAGQGYRARVLDSPAGEAITEFSLPFSPLEMENFLLRLASSLSAARRRIRGLESPERDLIQRFGGQLFGAVFTGPVGGALQASLNQVLREDTGLRLRLRLTDTPELADVPWELLFDPTADRFLNLTPDTPLVRYLDLPVPVRPLTVSPPIKVLVMISSPVDYPQLDVEAEWSRLQSALGDLLKDGLVTITRLPNATLASLQRPLRLDQYHVLHFIGHGGFVEQAQEGALVVEDGQGRARLVTGQDLGIMLSGHRSLRLVVLNACEGARASSSDPFAGVAQGLVRQGIPAVIAMQFEITDEAAITFAQELYTAVADGYPVDAAIGEARRAIFASGNDVEWATPVLHMRSPNGLLFNIPEGSTRPAGAVADRPEAGQALSPRSSVATEHKKAPAPVGWTKGRLVWVVGAIALLVTGSVIGLVAALAGNHPGPNPTPTGPTSTVSPTPTRLPTGVLSQGTTRLPGSTEGIDLVRGKTVPLMQSHMAWDGSRLWIFDDTTMGAVNLGRVPFEDFVPAKLQSLRYRTGSDNPPLSPSDIPAGTVLAVHVDPTTYGKLQIVNYDSGVPEIRWVTYRVAS